MESCAELFGEQDEILHTISLIPYPVFVKKQNYTGHSPKLLKCPFLMKYVYDNFLEEMEALQFKDNVLIIPLGRAVEEVLELLAQESKLDGERILYGFPHPSGANVNRIPQLEANKEGLIKKIQSIW